MTLPLAVAVIVAYLPFIWWVMHRVAGVLVRVVVAVGGAVLAAVPVVVAHLMYDAI